MPAFCGHAIQASHSVSLLSASDAGLNTSLEGAHVGPEKVLCTKQKPANYHLLALVLLLRIHRASPVSIFWDNPSHVLWNPPDQSSPKCFHNVDVSLFTILFAAWGSKE